MERSITYIALFAALIAALGLIPKLNLAFGVPITAQGLGVMLCGMVLGAKRGTMAVLLFLLLVAVGLPLLAGGRGGLGVFAAPTVGYLIGWIAGAFITGLIVEKLRTKSFTFDLAIAGIIGGIFVVYVFGIIGLMFTTELTLASAIYSNLIFIPGDLVKVAIAATVTTSLYKVRPASVFSRFQYG